MKLLKKAFRNLLAIAIGAGVILASVTLASGQLPTTIYIDFPVTDALLSEDGEYLYLSSKTDYKLYIVNLTYGNVDYISFDKMPESLTITPQEDTIYLALLTREHEKYGSWEHEGYIAEIDPDTRSLVREFWINEDPYDIVATSNGYLYVSSGSGQWDEVRGYNLSTTAESGSAFIRNRSKIKLHPSENYIYAADTDLSPSDIEKFGISVGSIEALYDSPYHGDYPMCGDLEISSDGTKIFTKCGHVFWSTEDQSTDMTYIATLGDRWNSLTFDSMNNVYTINDTSLKMWHHDTFEQIWEIATNGKGRFVFYKDGYLILVAEDGDFASKSIIQIIDPTLLTSPTVTTGSTFATGGTTATSGGNVTADGGSFVTARGVCWSTSPNPTISDSKTVNGSGTGSFTSSIAGLYPLTTYHVRAYATNSLGTSYGNDVRITTYLNKFGMEVGNRWTYQGTLEGNPYTVEREITTIDQSSFPVPTYVFEIKENGSMVATESYEHAGNQVKLWGTTAEYEGSSYTFTFSQGLLAGWFPMEVNDHEYSLALTNILGYNFYASLTVDVIKKEPITLGFDTLEAYEVRYQFRVWGPFGIDVTESFSWWMVPYIGVVKEERADVFGELTSFAIGGGTITETSDADNDRLKDYQELLFYDTSGLDADTDDDGCVDGAEVSEATDPNNPDSRPPPQGDLNADCIVDLGDAITALQLLSRIESVSVIELGADVNGDGKIGLEEVIYIIQRVSGLR